MNALLTAILNGAVIGVPLVAAVWLALRIFQRALNAATRYTVWWVALLVQVALPAFLLPVRNLSPISSMVTPSNRIEPNAPTKPNAAAVAIPDVTLSTPAVREGIAPNRPFTPTLTWNPGTWSKPIVMIWALVSGFLLFRLFLGYIALERKKQCAANPSAASSAVFQALVVRCGMRRRVRLAILPTTEAPMAAGPFRPCVLIPRLLLDTLETADLEQVYLHEIAHLARFDDIALCMQRVIQSVLFFHPTVRWILSRIDLEREIACDDFVVETTGQPVPYARCLTRIIELCGFAKRSAAAAIGRKSSQLERRINMLVNETRHAGARFLRWRFAFSCFLLLIVAFAITRAPLFLALADQSVASTPRTKTTPELYPHLSPEVPTPQIVAQVAAPRERPPLTNRTAPAKHSQVIRVPISVTDPLHRFVAGLDKTSFRIFDNDIEQQITDLVSPEAPVSLAVVWDMTERNEPSPQVIQLRRDKERLLATYTARHPSVAHVEEQIAMAEEAEKQQGSGRELLDFLCRHYPRDRFSLTRVPDSSNRYASLLQAIRTASQSAPSDVRSALVIISDLKWDTTFRSEADLRKALGSNNVPFYVVDVGGQVSVNSGASATSAVSLARIATQSGGAELSVSKLSDLPGLATKLDIELHNIYFVDYVPNREPSASEYHRITVRLEQPRGLPELSLQYRTGYYASR